MENTEQKFYENLRLSEKRKLRQEFDGFRKSIAWFVIYFFAFALMTVGMILFMIVVLSPKRQYWQLSGITMMTVGMFVLFSMIQMMMSKQKNVLKAFGSKKRVVNFFVALTISLIGNILVMVFIFTKGKMEWLYWVCTTMPFLGTLIFLIPYINTTKKDIETTEEEKKFFAWLEKEKNIIRTTGSEHKGTAD